MDVGNASVSCAINSNVITTLSAECPDEVTITPDTEPFEPGDVLTCIADGYSPTYTWTGTAANGDVISQTGSLYTLPAGVFELTCTATVSQLTCTETASSSVTGTSVGKCRIQLNTLEKILMLMTLSVSCLSYFNCSSVYFDNTHMPYVSVVCDYVGLFCS